MLILQIPPRVIRIHGTLKFPCEACVEADLSPKELFGLERLSGRLPLGRGGSEVEVRPDMVDGGILFNVSGRLDTLRLDATLLGMNVSITDGHLRASWTCTSEQHLRSSVAALDVTLPALLAATVPCPVYLGELTGRVGEAGLTYEFRGTTERAFYSVSGELLANDMADRLAAFDSAAISPSIALLTSAHRYLLQARRLGYASNHSTDFIGERLLNLYKALEVLFGRSAEHLRRDLGTLGIAAEVIEGIFVALLYVRDELDVGHPALHTLDPADWERMHAFAERAEDGITWLLGKLTRAVAEGTFKLRSLSSNTSQKSKLLKAIAARADVRVKAYGPGEWKKGV